MTAIMNQTNNIMRYKILFMLVLMTGFIIPSQAKMNKDWNVKVAVVSPVDNQKGVYSIDSLEFYTYTSKYSGMLYFCLTNNSTSRVYIEWQNAKINSDRVFFGDDSRLTMHNTKPDEAIAPGSLSETRTLFTDHNIAGNFLVRWWFKKDVKKGVSPNLILTIPVKKYGQEAKDYKFEIKFVYEGK